jgi:hypothetical protein
MCRAEQAFAKPVLRAALYCFLIAGLSAGWLAMAGAGCVITLDRNIALLGVVGGALASVAFVLVALKQALTRWWDVRRSRGWRLP